MKLKPASFTALFLTIFYVHPWRWLQKLQLRRLTSLRGATGTFGRVLTETNNLGRADALTTAKQALSTLPRTAGFGGLTPILGPRGRNGLPLQSWIVLSKPAGTTSIFMEMKELLCRRCQSSPASRIQRGIEGNRGLSNRSWQQPGSGLGW